MTLLAVDGTNLLYQSHYALARSGLTHAGRPIWAVHGLVSALARLVQRYKADSLLVAFDSPGGCPARRALLPAYKQTRKPPALDLAYQLEWAPTLLTRAGLNAWQVPGWEADDGIASATSQATGNAVAVSTDRDLIQLVDQRTIQSLPDGTRIDSAYVLDKYAVTPKQYPHLAALRGEPSDNLPGVPGIGAKGAAALVARFDTVPGVLEASDSELRSIVGPKAIAAIREHGDLALTCLHVGTLRRDLPVARGRLADIDATHLASELRQGGLFKAADALSRTVERAGQLSER